ncbi:MAG: sigma-70 family RNA polymerase sigma factor [Proteobacteria bacterium]|nr:sigma-70 family RNA polymerase sigma factor [Pseudomonadota bacterium]
MPPTDVQAARLYHQYGALIHRRCRRILRDDEEAWDATQEVFARAIRSWDSWDGTASRLTWLSRIATNHCLNVIRDRQGRRAKLDQRQAERPGAGTGPSAHGQVELLDIVRAVMDGMDPDLQRLAILYWFDEMTQQEIAVEVGLSVPTVRKRLRVFVDRARKQLRSGFESQIIRAIRAEQ